MNIDKIIENVPFLRESEVIEEIKEGTVSRIKLKVKNSAQVYFVKIDKFKGIPIQKWKKLYSFYEELELKVPHLVDVLIFPDYNVFIYDFIDGVSLDKLTTSDEKIQEYGKRLAQMMKKLQQKKEDYPFVSEKQEDVFFDQRIKMLNSILENDDLFDKISPYFTKDDIKLCKNTFQKLHKSISWQEKSIIHGDVKPKNVLITEKDELYLIDIDFYPLTSFIFDIQYGASCLHSNIKETKQRKYFIQGYYKELFCDNYPNEFEKQWIYVYLGELFYRIKTYLESNSMEKINALLSLNDIEFIHKIIENKNHFVFSYFLEQ